jgi:hypothetical protein
MIHFLIRLPVRVMVPAPLNRTPPTMIISHGRAAAPPGLKKPTSVPAPDGAGPLVKARPEGDCGVPGAEPLAATCVVGDVVGVVPF